MAICTKCNNEILDGQACAHCSANEQSQGAFGGFSLNGLLSKPAPAKPAPPPVPNQGIGNPAPQIPPTAPKPPASQPNRVTQNGAPPLMGNQPQPPASPTPPSNKAPGLTINTPTAQRPPAPPVHPAISNPPPAPAPTPSPIAQPPIHSNSRLPNPAQVSSPPPPPPSAVQEKSSSEPISQLDSILEIDEAQNIGPKPDLNNFKIHETPAKKEEVEKVADTRSEEEKQLQNQVFTSNITGYGDEDLEIAILAGLLKDPYILESLNAKGLITGLFSTRFSRTIFRGIVSLREENPQLSSVDKIVIKNKLQQINQWDSATKDFMDKIFSSPAPLMDQALHYLELLKEQALKRKLKEVSFDINEFIEGKKKDQNLNLETFTNGIIQNVRNIQKARTTKRINLVKEEMQDIIADIEDREVKGEVDIIGYSFEPMHYLNKAVSGFRKGFMYAIAGAPRRGKTTFTLELATRVATLNQIPVLFFTYEQTKKNLTYRLLAKESRLNPDSLQRKKIRSDMIMDAKFMGGWKKMQEYMDYFYIVEATKEDTVDRIRSYAYNVMQDFNTQDIMIFVDYIQKMPLSRNYMDEKFKVEEISTELKGLSIELNNPIMTISSLSKEGCMIDATPDAERPTMYHCKGSGDLEYDLDCAMIQAKDWGDTRELYQQLEHKAEELGKDTTRIPKVDVVNLYLDKNRDAPEGIFSTIQYLFFIEDNKFVELGPKFDDDRYRFSKIEELVDKLIEQNFIIFFDKPKDNSYNKGRVSIKLKNF